MLLGDLFHRVGVKILALSLKYYLGGQSFFRGQFILDPKAIGISNAYYFVAAPEARFAPADVTERRPFLSPPSMQQIFKTGARCELKIFQLRRGLVLYILDHAIEDPTFAAKVGLNQTNSLAGKFGALFIRI